MATEIKITSSNMYTSLILHFQADLAVKIALIEVAIS